MASDDVSVLLNDGPGGASYIVRVTPPTGYTNTGEPNPWPLTLADGDTLTSDFTLHRRPTLDIDGNGSPEALTDGLLIIRSLFGFQGDSLFRGGVAGDATRDEAAMFALLDQFTAIAFDIDGNGVAEALTDGLLIIRYLFGFQGTALIAGLMAGDATRSTFEEILNYLDTTFTAQPNATAAASAVASIPPAQPTATAQAARAWQAGLASLQATGPKAVIMSIGDRMARDELRLVES